MLTREEILSGYKEVKFPDKLFDNSIKKIKDILFYKDSTEPSSNKLKNTQKIAESYVLPRRILMQKNIVPTHEFIRGGNFTPKEPIIEIKIDNFKLIYDKFTIPIETNIIYLKNTYGGLTGPYNLDNIKNLYKTKKIDSNNEFRIIDIFSFKDTEPFSFQSLKIINDEKWIDLVIDNPLINYSDLFKIKKEEEVKVEDKKENIKEQKVIKETEEKWEVAGKKKKKKSKEVKEVKEVKEEKKESKEEKKEEKKDEKGKIDTDEKLENKINKEIKENNAELVEIFKRKKKEKDKLLEKEKEDTKNINANEIEKKEDKKEREVKEVRSKKGKKKKKTQFEETQIDLGFQVK